MMELMEFDHLYLQLPAYLLKISMTYFVNEYLFSNISHGFVHTTIRRTDEISDK